MASACDALAAAPARPLQICVGADDQRPRTAGRGFEELMSRNRWPHRLLQRCLPSHLGDGQVDADGAASIASTGVAVSRASRGRGRSRGLGARLPAPVPAARRADGGQTVRYAATA